MHDNRGEKKSLLSIFHTWIYWTATSHALPGFSRQQEQEREGGTGEMEILCVKPMGQTPFKE